MPNCLKGDKGRAFGVNQQASFSRRNQLLAGLGERNAVAGITFA
jgi:hypothetical protein